MGSNISVNGGIMAAKNGVSMAAKARKISVMEAWQPQHRSYVAWRHGV